MCSSTAHYLITPSCKLLHTLFVCLQEKCCALKSSSLFVKQKYYCRNLKYVHVTVTKLGKVQDEMDGNFLNSATDQYI